MERTEQLTMSTIESFFKGMARLAVGGSLPAVLGVGFLVFTLPLRAAFLGPYEFSDFTLININADGTAAWDGTSLLLTGGDNGSGVQGFTNFFAVATEAGIIKFDYSYVTTDLYGDPLYDEAGYVVAGVFTQLYDPPSGHASFAVEQGQGFGFQVRTEDNTVGPAILTITPAQTQAIPEPATTLPIFLVRQKNSWVDSGSGSLASEWYRASSRQRKVRNP